MYAALVGARVKRKEDPRLITGTARYVADLSLPGMGHVVFVRSPYAHARLLGIDTAAATLLTTGSGSHSTLIRSSAS